MACLHDPANVQQTSSKCIQNRLHVLMLDVWWMFAGSCKHPISCMARSIVGIQTQSHCAALFAISSTCLTWGAERPSRLGAPISCLNESGRPPAGAFVDQSVLQKSESDQSMASFPANWSRRQSAMALSCYGNDLGWRALQLLQLQQCPQQMRRCSQQQRRSSRECHWV